MDNLDVSVIIPVKDGQRHLDLLLKGIYSQEINAKFEVIIIDSGSKDMSLDIVRQYPVRLYQIHENEFNHGLTRNLGISKSRGEYIILMSQDAIPYNKYWMKKLVDNLKYNECIAGAYSRQVPHRDSCPITQMRVNRFFTSDRIKRESRINKIEDYDALSPRQKYRFCNFDNVSSCIKKSVWEKIPFSKTDFAEDLEWSKKVLEAGYKIIYEPDSVVYHSHDFSILDWFSRNRVNSKKLYGLFGISTIDSFYKIFLFFSIYTFRDLYFLFKEEKQFKNVISSFYLIPLFSFSGILGQYKGIQGHKHSNNIL